MVFEDQNWTIEEACRRINHEYDEIIRLLRPTLWDEGAGQRSARWLPPPLGIMKLNSDDSYWRENNTMGGGGVIRDSRGHWQHGYFLKMVGGNPLMEEAIALRTGLELAWNTGYREVRCEVDCKELVQGLRDHEICRFCPELQGINNWCRRDWKVEIIWVPRECNMVADHLAKRGINQNLPATQFSET